MWLVVIISSMNTLTQPRNAPKAETDDYFDAINAAVWKLSNGPFQTVQSSNFDLAIARAELSVQYSISNQVGQAEFQRLHDSGISEDAAVEFVGGPRTSCP